MTMDIAGFCLPRYAQIPGVGLYLEQVVRYINAQLAPLGEPELTSSMVSNYVKQGSFPRLCGSCTPRSTLRACFSSPWSSRLSRWRGCG